MTMRVWRCRHAATPFLRSGRRPIALINGNVVFGETLDDVWAVYRLGTRPYASLPVRHAPSLPIPSFARSIGTDFALMRVWRPWSVERYVMGVEATASARHVHRTSLAAYLRTHREYLRKWDLRIPEVYVSVRLERRDGLLGREASMRRRILDHVACERPTGRELRSLMDSEQGEEHQALLSVGALPGARVGRLLAALDSIGFPVDSTLSLVPDETPLASMSLCVCASSARELGDRIERVRRECGSVRLHRDLLPVERLGGVVPISTRAVGAYIGHTLGGVRQPVLYDSTRASRDSRPPVTLLAGARGSGKTLCLELIMYQAFLAGSTICAVDTGSDHALERLPGVAEHMEIIELSADERFRGVLDPLRIAPADMREDLATSFLLGLLPEPVAAEWRTEIRLATRSAVAAASASCEEVIAQLARGGEHARAAARALRIGAGTGLAGLGFAGPGARPLAAGSKQLTTIRLRDLAPDRAGRAILRLLAVYALRLTSADARRPAVLVFDEADVLLSDRELVDRLGRLGRARNVTALLAGRVPADVDALDGLIGTCFCFGVQTEREARKAMRLLRLEADDEAMRRRLLSYRRGRCLMRDFADRVSPVQIDLDPALDTSTHGGARRCSLPGTLEGDVPRR